MAGRALVIAAAGLLLLGACGWEIGRNTVTDDATVSGQITRVRMSSDSGDVRVRAGNETKVHRTVHFDRDKPGPTHRLEGDVLVIDSCPVRDCSIDYEVTVPAGTRLDSAMDSGTFEVTGLAAVNLKIDSGDVTLREIPGPVNVESESGLVRLDEVGEAVVVRSASGNVTVDNARGAVTVQADSGNVSVRLTVAQSVRAQSDSGNVTVTVPRAAYRVNTSTDSGQVKAGVANDPSGTHALDLHTDSGNIDISQG